MNEDIAAIVGFGIIAVSWLAPIPIGAWMLRRKGFSPHWTWFGIVPFVGLVVILVAIFLTARSGKLKGLRPRQAADASSWYEQYQKGMRDLGSGLIALGLLQALATVLLYRVSPSIIPVLLVGTMAVLHIILGLFARKLHSWVNYVVAALASVILALNVVNLTLIDQNSERPNPGSNLGVFFGFIIAAALFYFSVNNFQNLRRANAAGEKRDC